MKTYLIICQASLPESSYYGLASYLKTAPQWAKPFANTWIVKTTADISVVRDGVRERTFKIDKILVTEIAGSNWATFNVSQEVTNWMKNNL